MIRVEDDAPSNLHFASREKAGLRFVRGKFRDFSCLRDRAAKIHQGAVLRRKDTCAVGRLKKKKRSESCNRPLTLINQMTYKGQIAVILAVFCNNGL